MPIIPKEPITTEPKTYDRMWIHSITISAPTVGGDSRVQIHAIPYNSVTGDSDHALERSYSIDSVFSEIKNGNINCKGAMHYIIAACQGIINK